MLSSQDLKRLVEIRHHLHRHPELSCAEEQTAAFLAERLAEIGLPVVTENGNAKVDHGSGVIISLRAM